MFPLQRGNRRASLSTGRGLSFLADPSGKNYPYLTVFASPAVSPMWAHTMSANESDQVDKGTWRDSRGESTGGGPADDVRTDDVFGAAIYAEFDVTAGAVRTRPSTSSPA